MSGKPIEVEVVAVRAKNTKADGTAMLTKTGKPMWATNIQISERPGVWINGLTFSDPSDWAGTKKTLAFYTDEYQGKEVPKFKVPPPPRTGGIPIEKLDEMIGLLREIRDAVTLRHTGEPTIDEARWFDAVEKRLQFGGDNKTTSTMRCPVCEQEMSACRRSKRLTFGGWEPACIQVQCDACGLGGELPA